MDVDDSALAPSGIMPHVATAANNHIIAPAMACNPHLRPDGINIAPGFIAVTASRPLFDREPFCGEFNPRVVAI